MGGSAFSGVWFGATDRNAAWTLEARQGVWVQGLEFRRKLQQQWSDGDSGGSDNVVSVPHKAHQLLLSTYALQMANVDGTEDLDGVPPGTAQVFGDVLKKL
jgi:hypothetical protein